MKTPLKLAYYVSCIALLISLLTSCNANSSVESETVEESKISSLEGRWILQPTEYITALAMSSNKALMYITFIDSTYCNIDIKSLAGDVTISRKYKINNSKIFFEDPLTGKSTTYVIKPYNSGSRNFHMDQDSVEIFRGVGYNDSVKNLIYSESSLKRQEFLYPTLSEKEREFGVEQIVTDEKGRMNLVKSPAADEVSKVNLYKLF